MVDEGTAPAGAPGVQGQAHPGAASQATPAAGQGRGAASGRGKRKSPGASPGQRGRGSGRGGGNTPKKARTQSGPKATQGSQTPNRKKAARTPKGPKVPKVPSQGPPGAKGPSALGALTLQEISGDRLTRIAAKHWSPRDANANMPAFKPELVQTIYDTELGGMSKRAPGLRRIMLLEVSQYLERYLWPNFDAATATPAHVLSMVLMINEKFREGVPAWSCFESHNPNNFPAFFHKFVSLKQEAGRQLKRHELVAYLMFTINVFQSLENEMVRKCVLNLVSLPLWHCLSDGRRQLELHAQPQLAKRWAKLVKKEQKASSAGGYVAPQQRADLSFVPRMVDEFLSVLDAAVPAANGQGQQAGGPHPQTLLYCERFMEWLIDVLSQLPTRRLVHAVLEDKQVLVKSKLSALYKHPRGEALSCSTAAGQLFLQLVDLYEFYTAFPINEHTGEALKEDDVTAGHYERVQQLQRLLFKHWPHLREPALMNCGTLQQPSTLRKWFNALTADDLHTLLVKQLRLVPADDPKAHDKAFLLEALINTFKRRQFQREVVNAMPLYPTEQLLFDENQVPSVHYSGEHCLALPKLNLQFLTLYDYLLRNFNLFRLEATYEIREDMVDVIKRLQPYWTDDEKVGFKGWARMGITLQSFAITEVKPPKVGEDKPAAVTADIVLDTMGLRGDVRGEWDELRQHDVLFLLTMCPPDQVALSAAAAQGMQPSQAQQYGLLHVRGCEIIEVKDEEGQLMNDFTGRVRPDERKPPAGTVRTLTVALDSAQYQLDTDYLAANPGADDVYASFNILMRRKAKENNFKAVLESIRDLMNEDDVVVPDWLHDIFLGYGDPGAAQYTHMPDQLRTIDFLDTFLDEQHVKDSFPQYDVKVINNSGTAAPIRPFRITFPPPAAAETTTAGKGHANGHADMEGVEGAKPELVVESYTPPNPGPYPQDKPPLNSVRFTPVQVEAIVSGVQPGLTMVVGPPGTGKTDTAVQIMEVLYHNEPRQRTLLITHSNQALNDLFTKILQRDVPARYLLRLGMGEQELETDLNFSRVGRVNAMLARRLELLAEVEKMARQFNVSEDVAYTCETAAHFWLLHVLSRWEKFSAQAGAQRTAQCVQDLFPFKDYFASAPQPLFKGERYEQDWEIAMGCFRHLKTMFQELEECRAFELLKGQADRVNYLMTKQAKIVAMTCTHAALKRREFLNLAFKYDNLLMEESAQILEVETFIPMMLQRQEDGYSRLKRVIMIGDHHQLPPVVKNMAFQKFSHLDQSLFTRFVRLGTPYVELNAQGRARPTLAKLYNWRYRDLGDLPLVSEDGSPFQLGNAGFAHELQFINVPDFNGRGESEPLPYFYQNLGEAEYLVTLYQYMRLLGYPATKISVLTTYNGQKALLKDVFERRCVMHPAYGRPATITTVDKFQGQQNDYVLLSLVRTRTVGHLRDVRRLVVAMSRARLGLYIFGRFRLFMNCYELQPTFKQLQARPLKPQLLTQERWGATQRKLTDRGHPRTLGGMHELAALVGEMLVEWERSHLAEMAKAKGVPAPAPPTAPPPGTLPPSTMQETADAAEEVAVEAAAEADAEEELAAAAAEVAAKNSNDDDDEEEEGSGDDIDEEEDDAADEGAEPQEGDGEDDSAPANEEE